FGFTLRLRIADHRAQLNVGEGAVVLIEADPNSPSRSSVLVRLDDVNAHHEHARQNGARILRPPTDYPFGERQYRVEDFAGNRWTFSQSIADVDPADWGGTPGLL
ncbi:MAG TPA: VOC family protein, partial [Candidatus Acidoferrum sp.]|nr:VOC family protein [Candidatus Acidoferrum sp.]